MVALTLNKRFNFSRLIYEEMVENIKGKPKDKFLLYPRFLQMFFDRYYPLFPHTGPLCELTPMDIKIFSHSRKYKSKNAIIETRLFGHPLDVNYLPPPGNAVRHPGEPAPWVVPANEYVFVAPALSPEEDVPEEPEEEMHVETPPPPLLNRSR